MEKICGRVDRDGGKVGGGNNQYARCPEVKL